MELPYQLGFFALTWGHLILICVGLTFIYLAIAKRREPYELLPIGAGMILANLPLTGLLVEPNSSLGAGQAGLLGILRYYGIFHFTVLPQLIFLGLGAMTDFGPLLADPKGFLLGAAAQIGIFIAFAGALALGFWGIADFGLKEACAIAIIGGADGPTTIYTTAILAPELMGITAVAAYSYMAMVSIIQPPIIRALTTRKERETHMESQLREVSKLERIVFPIMLLLVVGLLVPRAAPLVGMFAVGNLLRESGVVDRLSETAQTSFTNIITIILMLCIGASLPAELVMKKETLMVLGLGLVAFCGGTAGGVLMGKLMSLLSKHPFNPILGAAGVSAVPMAARVANHEGQRANPRNFLLMHAMGPNVAGVIGSAIVAGVFLGMVG
ncbi:MAG: sodium ion-translocating decarboxylase subunit beta [Dehalococcoidia bacterium]|nr:sodium ion-translocating decarboxylase subunit beta [Dehalococcoidia bacterium]